VKQIINSLNCEKIYETHHIDGEKTKINREGGISQFQARRRVEETCMQLDASNWESGTSSMKHETSTKGERVAKERNQMEGKPLDG
jgi:hypothetical protein